MKEPFYQFRSNILIFGVLCTFPQSGIWSGDLDVQGIKLPLVFNLDNDNPTMDSPAQGVKGIPVTVTNTATGSI